MAMDGSKDRGLAAMRNDDVRTAELEALEAERAGERPAVYVTDAEAKRLDEVVDRILSLVKNQHEY